MPHTTDLDLKAKDIGELASADAITSFLAKLGYDTNDRALLSPEAVGLSGESASAIKKIELLAEDPEQFFRVVFAQPKSLTAKVRNDLVRVLGKSNLDHMLVLASDFDTLELDAALPAAVPALRREPGLAADPGSALLCHQPQKDQGRGR